VFERLSEEHGDVVFIKADVDELAASAQSANISAMPTFHIMKDGAVVEEMLGADPTKLTAMVAKHAK
jgi:thioredoxin 1